MSSAKLLLPSRLRNLFLKELSQHPDGLPSAGPETAKQLERVLRALGPDYVAALAGASALNRSDDWLELEIVPAATFKAPDHTPGSSVRVGFSHKTGRFVSDVPAAFRFGYVDLARHIWHIRAPGERLSAETRLLAMLGKCLLWWLVETSKKSVKEAA
jgi:hypothetical protein